MNEIIERLAELEVYSPPQIQTNPDVLISASNDVDATITWLKKIQVANSAHTFDAYKREAQRLLVWLTEVSLTFSELRAEHIQEYFSLLGNPPKHWIKPVKVKKSQVLLVTQLLTSPLSNKSLNYSRLVLAQLFTYLHAAGYLKNNVFKIIPKLPVVKSTSVSKFLSVEAWNFLWNFIVNLPVNSVLDRKRVMRFRWVMALLYHTGLRRENAAIGTMGDFIRRSDNKWQYRIIGKGNKENFVSVNYLLLEELVNYRRSCGLPDLPSPGEPTPLVMSVNGKRSIRHMTPRSIGKLVHDIALLAAPAIDDPQIQIEVSNMSTHWLRHTNGTHRLMAGASLLTTQEEFAHADIRTTQIYAKVASDERMHDANKLADFHTSITK